MNIELAKKICKEHGVKGFRKLKLKRVLYTAGKQCSRLTPFVAERLLNRLVEEGFEISGLEASFEAAKNGFLDTITVG